MSPSPSRGNLRVVVVGHVGHGKSTLIGRLFHDLGALPPGKIEAIQAMCERRGMPFEWAFLLDALQAERDQRITIETAQIWLRDRDRDIIFIDAPGHKEFLRNMVTGAAGADAALLVIDAGAGVEEQSRRHGYLLHFLGLRQVAVAVTKTDLAGYDKTRFAEVASVITSHLANIGLDISAIVPVSARQGENVVAQAKTMGWYRGPTLIEAIRGFKPLPSLRDLPLRLAIQDVYNFDQRRILVGRVEAGSFNVGDRLLFSPANSEARVVSIETWPHPRPDAAPPLTEAAAGQSVGITLDRPLFIERGALASHPERAPLETEVFRARLFWLGREPLAAGARLDMKILAARAHVTLEAIERVIDPGELDPLTGNAVPRHAGADVILRADRILALDAYGDCAPSGRFVLVKDYAIVGGGLISMEGYPDQRGLVTVRATNIKRELPRVSTEERTQRNGHKGGVLWLTGLSGSGKSTLALELERRLFARGYLVYVLDGDNLRFGLNADLGFSPEERTENIRRAGEVAALFAAAGFVVITAFISPYRSDRARVRRAVGQAFHEIYLNADIAICEERDPKGLYKRARAGEIADFTGISAPYEAPEAAELQIDTGSLDVEESLNLLLEYVIPRFALRGK